MAYAIFRERERPFLIWAAPPFLALNGLLATAFVVLVAIDRGPGSLVVADTEIGRVEFLVMVLPLTVGFACLNLAGAYGLFVERGWARSLLTKWSLFTQIVGVGVLALGSPRLTSLSLNALPQFIVVGLLFWYFYGYGPTKTYYERLKAAGGQ